MIRTKIGLRLDNGSKSGCYRNTRKPRCMSRKGIFELIDNPSLKRSCKRQSNKKRRGSLKCIDVLELSNL